MKKATILLCMLFSIGIKAQNQKDTRIKLTDDVYANYKDNVLTENIVKAYVAEHPEYKPTNCGCNFNDVTEIGNVSKQDFYCDAGGTYKSHYNQDQISIQSGLQNQIRIGVFNYGFLNTPAIEILDGYGMVHYGSIIAGDIFGGLSRDVQLKIPDEPHNEYILTRNSHSPSFSISPNNTFQSWGDWCGCYKNGTTDWYCAMGIDDTQTPSAGYIQVKSINNTFFATIQSDSLTNNHIALLPNNDGKIQVNYTGTGNPNGVVTANQGSLYIDPTGGTLRTLWVKETGGFSNNGWVNK